MSEAIAPLSASARMTDADWPGVVAQLAPDWRLVVSSDGKRYALQQLGQTDAGPLWLPAGGGRSPGTLARIVAKYGERVAGLAALCESLPDDPSEALPGFVWSVAARDVLYKLRDVRRSAYGRVVARDGQLRLAVDPDGLRYLLQWVPKADLDLDWPVWQVLLSAATLSDVRAFMLDNVFQPEGSGYANRRRGDDLLPRVDAFLSGLPERADAGVWPVIHALQA